MSRLMILHTNDIHGRSVGLARVITLVKKLRAENPDRTVLYFDCGDVEDTSNRLSNLTKGRAMYRLLGLAQPAAAVVGNASILRYGGDILTHHAQEVGCPLLLANILTPAGNLFPGLRATTMIDAGRFRLGIIGVSWHFPAYTRYFGYQMPDTIETVRRLITQLYQDSAGAVIVLSHLGLDLDYELADTMQGQITAIVGAHTHNLLPTGEWRGDVLIAQAGQYAEHLGCIDLVWRDDKLIVEQACVLPITEDIAPDPAVQATEQVIEQEVADFMNETIGLLATPLDWAEDRECGVANLMADALRQRMQADVGLCVAGAAFKGGLPGGELRRGALWEVCDSSANPGLTTMTGAQLASVIRNGLAAERAAERPRPLRGRARGLMHLSGATVVDGMIRVDSQPLDPDKRYRVAASDFELEPDFAYTDAAWQLEMVYHVPTILREALEDFLATQRPVAVVMPRLEV